jgi:hypothetical protein
MYWPEGADVNAEARCGPRTAHLPGQVLVSRNADGTTTVSPGGQMTVPNHLIHYWSTESSDTRGKTFDVRH